MSIFALPFVNFFNSTKNILVVVFIAVTCLVAGVLVYKYSSTKNQLATNAVAVAKDAAQNNAVDTNTAVKSGEIAVETVVENTEAKVEVAKKEVAITTKKKEKIEKIKVSAKETLAKVEVTEEKKEVVEKELAYAISVVQIDALWDSYCNTLTPLSDVPLDDKVACLL